MNQDYWIKSDELINPDIFWNIPEQKTGTIQIIGGNSNSFSTEIKQAEFLNSLPIREVRLLLPDALHTKVPPVPGINFAPSTESGSFDKSNELKFAISDADITLLSGDFSKNSKTSVALTAAVTESIKPIVMVRDTVDALADSAEDFIEKGNITIVASMIQLQKLFRSLLYPKMIMLSAPLMQIVETLHKFTLSYPVTILTFHQDKIIVASGGQVITTSISSTEYSPIGLFVGNLASKIAALQLFAPGKPLETTHSAIFWNQ
jgi:hypothetical protein